MSDLFLRVVNLSITASWLILAVIAVRPLLKRAPKWTLCLLWALVALRFLLPFAPESTLSLVPSTETIPQDIAQHAVPAVDSGIPLVDEVVNPALAASPLAADPISSANPLMIYIPLAALVWLMGIAALLLHAFRSWRRLRKLVAASLPLEKGVMLCDEVDSPFLLGLFRPVIYLPSGLAEGTRELVLAHERAHLGRRDHWWKPLGYLILTIHWFNPLCWAAYALLCRDIELACDERVCRTMDRAALAAYSQALLDCGLHRRAIAACPLAFGEVGVKERVRAALRYRKPALWAVLGAALLCLLIALLFVTNPSTKPDARMELGMDMAVAEEMAGSAGSYHALNYQVLKVDRARDTATVYAWVVWKSFDRVGGAIREVKSASHPAVVTFDTSEKGDLASYPCLAYWVPQEGETYYRQLREKFPASLWRKVFGQPDYVEALSEELREDAEAHFLSTPGPASTAYRFEAPEQPGLISTVTLYEDGSYSFVFSWFSDYISIGTWSREGDTLTLEDGIFHFLFTEMEEGLIFHEEGSSDMRAGGKFTEGSLFRREGSAPPAGWAG